MEELAKKNIDKTSHSLLIRVYPNILIAEVNLPQDLYVKIIKKLGYGAWDAERYAISKFTIEVFSLEYDKKLFFNDYSSYYNKMQKYGLQIENNNNNKWFKTVVFPINEDNFQSELDKHITYIKNTSDNFDNGSYSAKSEIAKKLLNKL